MTMSSSFVLQHLHLWVKRVSHVGGPRIRLAMLDDVSSGLRGNPLRFKIYTYTHSVDYLEKWRENVNLNIYTVFIEKMAGKSRITFIRFVM